ncbi:MAG: hypothetical protein ABIA97_02645 [Candidatus Omnitrophota bacterium]
MDKKRTKIIIISGVFSLVLILVLVSNINIFIKKSKEGKTKSSASAAIYTSGYALALPAEIVSIAKVAWKQDDDLDWKRCIFSGISYSPETTSEDLSISGIIWDEVEPRTIINGKILKEGDSVGGFLIEKIEKQKVILSNDTKIKELNI